MVTASPHHSASTALVPEAGAYPYRAINHIHPGHEFVQNPTNLQRFRPGVAFYGYRWFDPEKGRWPSRDPIGERGGINLYGFIGNNSVTRIDVLGQIAAIQDPKNTLNDGIPGYDILVWHKVDDFKGSYVQRVFVSESWVDCKGVDGFNMEVFYDLWKNKDIEGKIIRVGDPKQGAAAISDGWFSPGKGEVCVYMETNISYLYKVNNDAVIDGLIRIADGADIAPQEPTMIVIDIMDPLKSKADQLMLDFLRKFSTLQNAFVFTYSYTSDCNGSGRVEESHTLEDNNVIPE